MPAPTYRNNPNPAVQYGMWESLALVHRPIGVLPPPLQAYADRLVLEVEQSWEDLGRVDVATFRLGGRWFVLSQFTDGPEWGVTVWLDRRHCDDEAGLALLVRTLGIPGDRVRDISHSPHPAVQHELNPPPRPEATRPASRWSRFLPPRRRRPGAGGGSVVSVP
ncbi:hypothetical protein [Streptomyces sp. NPDC090022]|uniref:hypothetical protein n=1 Tax=Streptomyces sp. NPDC090022 TaxID=3365920 RepID=UPI003816D964